MVQIKVEMRSTLQMQRPNPVQQRNLINSSRTTHGRGEHLHSLTATMVCLLPADLTVTHPTCPATLAVDRVTRRINVYDGVGWKPLIDTIVSQIPGEVVPVAQREIVREVVPEVVADLPEVKSDYQPSSQPSAQPNTPGFTAFSDRDFMLFSGATTEPLAQSTLKFDVVPYSEPRVVTVPRENVILAAMDDRSNTMLGEVHYSTTGSTGKDNTFVGAECGASISTGCCNVALGSVALSECVSGNNNIAIGYKSLEDTTMCNDNVSVGYKSLRKARGECNIALGSFSQAQNSIGSGNVSIGQDSLYSFEGGKHNIAIGHESGVDSHIGDNNVMVGAQTNFAPGTSGSIILGMGGTSSLSDQFVLSGKMSGVVQLQSGTGIVIYGGVTSSTRILLTIQEPNGVVGTVYVAGRIERTGFTVSSTSSKDNSLVGWFAIEP